VPFIDFGKSSLIAEAAEDLSGFSDFRGPKVGGRSRCFAAPTAATCAGRTCRSPCCATSRTARSRNQVGFGTYGAPHILSLVTEVATRALKAIWYQKWFVHRRLRSEAFPEGSPTHPAYGSAHATVAGACVTVLKEWFDESFVLADPVLARTGRAVPGLLESVDIADRKTS
jgi:hypothetical protein